MGKGRTPRGATCARGHGIEAGRGGRRQLSWPACCLIEEGYPLVGCRSALSLLGFWGCPAISSFGSPPPQGPPEPPARPCIHGSTYCRLPILTNECLQSGCAKANSFDARASTAIPASGSVLSQPTRSPSPSDSIRSSAAQPAKPNSRSA